MKRVIDFSITLIILLLLSPVILILSLLIAIKLGRPIIFKQIRPGLKGVLFNMIKFRSMSNERDSSGELLADHQRMTPFGRFLRATSLDELPALWCVLTGKMSLVGPRPLLVEYLPLYSSEQARRHDVKPGITGWAQINGRNAISWEEKFALDIWYVDNQSLWLDIKILCLTVQKVLVRADINEAGEVTMTKFTGNSHD